MNLVSYNRIDMEEETQKEKYITPIAIGFLTTIVPDFLSEAFSAYKKRDFTTDYWQVSNWEQWYGGAGVALAVSAIEANRNRLYYMKDMSVSQNVCRDILDMFSHLSNFPTDVLTSLIGEIFTIRDVILHSHIYEINAEFTRTDWKMIELKRTKLQEYGDKKFKDLVDTDKLKTKLLGMNVLPTNIGFEELFLVLFVFDLIVGILDKNIERVSFTYHLHQKLNNEWIHSLSELLTFYYDQIPSNSFKSRINMLVGKLTIAFGTYMEYGPPYFIKNICPKCHTIGFRKNRSVSHCSNSACNFKLGIIKMDH